MTQKNRTSFMNDPLRYSFFQKVLHIKISIMNRYKIAAVEKFLCLYYLSDDFMHPDDFTRFLLVRLDVTGVYFRFRSL